MIYKNVELFNVEEIREEGGWTKLFRFPQGVVSKMIAKDAALLVTGCEIRFVGEAYITLGCISSMIDNYGRVEVYRGNTFYGVHTFPIGERYTIKLAYATPAESCYDEVSNVWRVVFGHDYRGVLYDIEPMGEIRPPKPDEMPGKTIIAYGSSITHGAATVTYSNAYISKLAHKLGVNIENKGVGGGCMCEKEVADYISGRKCDLLYLELGVNMFSRFTPEEFYERAAYLMSNLNKDIPTVLVSPFKNSYFASKDENIRKKAEQYQETAEKLYNDFKRDNLHFISGLEIVDDYSMLTYDMIHPSMYGHQIMSERIYDRLKKIEF